MVTAHFRTGINININSVYTPIAQIGADPPVGVLILEYRHQEQCTRDLDTESSTLMTAIKALIPTTARFFKRQPALLYWRRDGGGDGGGHQKDELHIKSVVHPNPTFRERMKRPQLGSALATSFP